MRVHAVAAGLAALALLAGCGGDDEPEPTTTPALTVPTRGNTAPADGASPARSVPRPEQRAAGSGLARLRERVGRTIVFSFAGPSLPGYARAILRERRAAGVILFGRNVVSPGQVRGLTRTVQRAAGRRGLVMTDQEGGEIRILRFAPSDRGQPRQPTPAAARTAARATARALRRTGVNVNLAPVVDVPDGPVFRSRAYPGDAANIGASGRAAVGAYSTGGVAATAKHFPGIGSATGNTDFEAATVDRDRTQLLRRDLGPFRAAIAGNVPLIMSSHALFPGLDSDAIASMSKPILTDLLRGELGFKGVVVTDSMEADAVAARSSSVAAACVRAIRAGADIVLLTGPGSYPSVYRRLVREARRDPAFRARIDEAGRRVEALRDRLGL